MVPRAKKTGETLEITSPFDLSIIATTDVSNGDIIEQALKNAHQCYTNRETWIATYKRLDILDRLIKIMQSNAEDLALEAAREGGKPLVDSQIEVARAIDGVKLCIETMRTEGGELIPMGINTASQNKIAFTQHEPIGVIVAVSAFNHPLNLIVHQVAPAIATGCPVIVKPAKNTPISCFRFVEMLREAGLPEDWCQVVVTSNSTTSTQLIADNRVAFLSFIGSAKVGWMLRSKLAAGTRCALEHGGAAPVIIAKDADIEMALPKLVKGGFYHAGQVCVSVQRIYIHEKIAKDVAQKIATMAKVLRVGNPTEANTDIGPLISPKEVQRVSEWVDEAIKAGADILCGGKKLPNNCYSCTVLYNPPENVSVSTKEIFGPVICIYSYTDINDAIQRANQLPYSFQASVFSQNIDTTMYAYRQLNASAVMINDHTAFRVDWMPFAGLRESGLGVGGIPYTIKDMQITKMAIIHSKNL